MEGEWKVSPKIYKANKAGGLFGKVGDFFSGAASWPSSIAKSVNGIFSSIFGAGLWKFLRYGFLGLICVFLICIFLNCGGPQLIGVLFKKRNFSRYLIDFLKRSWHKFI